MRWHSCFFVVIAFLSGVAQGNGVYIPREAYPALPTIPVQRAIIVHRDGVQTLVVESAFQTESSDVAWILPLPTVPTKLDVGDAGMVTSACSALRPKITNKLDTWHAPIWLLVILVPFVWARVSTADRELRRSRYKDVLIISVVGLFVTALVVPQFTNASSEMGGPIAGGEVSVHSTQRLGDYQCTVLSSPDAGVLSAWLAECSMKPLDEQAKAVVADYIARKWCFVVTQLQPLTEEVATPKPLIATFETPTAVFPMKATSLANTKTRVELCVIADQQANAKHFTTQTAAAFEDRPHGTPHYIAPSVNLYMASPDVIPLMWDGCVVTKLVGDLLPEQMDADAVIGFVPLRAYREHFFSSRARWQVVQMVLWSALLVGLLIVAVIYRHARKPSRGQQRFMLGAVGLVVVAAGMVYLFLPTVPVQMAGGKSKRFDNSLSFLLMYINDYCKAVSRQGDQVDLTDANLLQKLNDGNYLPSGIPTNPYTGQPIRRERSPGNFDIRQTDGFWFLSTYDADGFQRHLGHIEPSGK
ncbi:MAG: DUF2330 domain-containing protein [Phycisphaerales bacterium]|nr:DUF2330 domain-containing protein [Phycisphaerales bacterium]